MVHSFVCVLGDQGEGVGIRWFACSEEDILLEIDNNLILYDSTLADNDLYDNTCCCYLSLLLANRCGSVKLIIEQEIAISLRYILFSTWTLLKLGNEVLDKRSCNCLQLCHKEPCTPVRSAKYQPSIENIVKIYGKIESKNERRHAQVFHYAAQEGREHTIKKYLPLVDS